MKSPVALAVVTIPALMSVCASVESRQDPFDRNPYRAYQESSPYDGWTPYEGDASVYGDPSPRTAGAGSRSPYPPGASRPWVGYGPPNWVQNPGDVPPGGGRTDPHWVDPAGLRYDLPPRYPMSPPTAARELPPLAQPEYRFRGDRQSPPGAVPWQDGYHFRPLTEFERDRIGYQGGWRPLDAGSTRERGSQDPLSREDAFGYQSDDWFRGFYPDWP